MRGRLKRLHESPESRGSRAGIGFAPSPNVPRRMLIIEDEAVLRNYLARLFARRGYEVTATGTCAEALNALAGAPVEILLLDVELPDGDGLNLLAGLGEQQRPRHTIVMTGCAAENALRAQRLDVRHVLRKPLDLTQLIGVLPSD